MIDTEHKVHLWLPTHLCLVFVDLQSSNYFWVKNSSRTDGVSMVLTSLTSETHQTLGMSGVLVRGPHHWVLMSICTASCVNTYLVRLLALASNP